MAVIVPAIAGKVIHIGRAGENLATTVQFDVTDWLKPVAEGGFGSDGTFSLFVQQGGGQIYPQTITEPGTNQTIVSWDVTNSNTATIGLGKCELVYSIQEVKVKSVIYDIVVTNSLDIEAQGNVPSAIDSWLNEISGMVDQISGAAEQADKAERYAKGTSNGVAVAADTVGYNDNAKYYSDLISDMTVSITTGSAGSDASINKTTIDNHYNLAFTIPRGNTGAQGPSGTITVDSSVTTGEPGTNASVSNSGSSTAANLHFTIPKGDKGDQGVGFATTLESLPEANAANYDIYKDKVYIYNSHAYSIIQSGSSYSWVDGGSCGSNGGTYYGTCSTAAGTAQKSVTCSGFVLTTGSIIGVLFTTANTAATPTLNVNSTTAKSIYIGNSAPNSTDNVLKWSANTMVYFVYDGTYYRYITSISAGTVVPSRGANTWYGTSSIGATTQAKTSTIDNFVLTKGAVVCITFSTANTYSSAKITLNVNSTGAKDIYYNGAVTSSTNTLFWNAGETVTFIYSGSYYYFVCKSTVQSPLPSKSGKSGKYLMVDSSEDIVWGDISGKTDKVSNATNGNFAALDSNGNLTDSGHKHSDYLTSHQDISGKANLNSPTFTGTPAAPTATTGTNTTQLATTAFVQNTMDAKITYGDTDLVIGTDTLAEGVIYLYIE